MVNRRGTKSRRRRPRKVTCGACGRRVAVPASSPAPIVCACGKPLDGGPGSTVRNGEVLSGREVRGHGDGCVYIPER